ncbi:hypothetical protein LCGC14_2956380 [marine sediment metagenome]|uniref:Uncharacterized protein n=1 Tax=marine sediment metagenome TaxID=412755 RepID=A0A0F8Y0W0_9ZZZZ
MYSKGYEVDRVQVKMIDFSRVWNNILAVLVLAAVIYVIYTKIKSQDIKEKIKGIFSRDKIGRGKL